MAPNKLCLKKKQYKGSLNQLRKCIAENRSGYFDVQPLLPCGQQEEVHLQLRGKDLYIIGFKGKSGWYHFTDQEKDGWGESCGVEGNYNKLEKVDKITLSSVKDLKFLAAFKSGDKLDETLVVIAAAVVSEALRFTEVADAFADLFNEKRTNVPLVDFKDRLFVNWALLSQENAPGVLLPSIP